MGFNWGAFSGGLAEGIEKGNEIAMKNKQLQATIEQNNQKMQDEVNKNRRETFKQASDLVTKYNAEVGTVSKSIANAQDTDSANTDIKAFNKITDGYRAQIEALKNDPSNTDASLQLLNTVNPQNMPLLSNYTIQDVHGKQQNVVLPEGLDDTTIKNLRLMDNGAIGNITIDPTTGVANGVQPTNYIPTKFKQNKESFSNMVSVIDPNTGQPIKMLPEEYQNLRKEGKAPTLYEKPQKETIVMGTSQPIQVANEFGTFYADPNTGKPIKSESGTPLYKEMNAQTQKTIESLDQSKRTIKSLNNMLDIINKNPKAIGSLGEDPVNYIANYANDYLGIPSSTLTDRTQIQGTSGVLTAMTRKLYENGVMTDKDYARYEKIMPQANDSTEVFKNKTKILIEGLNNNIKQTENRYKDIVQLRPLEDTTSNKKSLKDFGF